LADNYKILIDQGATDSTGNKQITISQTLNPGLYFIAGCSQGGTGTATFRSYVATSGDWSPVATTSLSASLINTCYIVSGVTGALPTISTYQASPDNIARTQFRVA
jgi:hypothetical protein